MAPPAPVLDHGPGPRWEGEPRRPQGGAYLMFTSGSTGVPKAVLVTLDNLTAYLDGAIELFGPTCEDRFAQVNNFTFDLLVHDIALPWTVRRGRVRAARPGRLQAPRAGTGARADVLAVRAHHGVSLLDLGLLRPGALPACPDAVLRGTAARRLAQAWHAANPDGELFDV